MEDEYEDWRIQELEDAWEMLTDEQKTAIQQRTLERQRYAEEQRQAFLNMTPEQKAKLHQDIDAAFKQHNEAMRLLIEQFATTKR